MLEHALQLVVVADADDVLEPELLAALGETRQRVLVVGREHHRVGGARLVRLQSVREQRQAGVFLQLELGAAHDDSLRAARLGTPGGVGVTDVHEHRDAVAFRDRLAQPSIGHGRGC